MLVASGVGLSLCTWRGQRLHLRPSGWLEVIKDWIWDFLVDWRRIFEVIKDQTWDLLVWCGSLKSSRIEVETFWVIWEESLRSSRTKFSGWYGSLKSSRIKVETFWLTCISKVIKDQIWDLLVDGKDLWSYQGLNLRPLKPSRTKSGCWGHQE